jgi:hypothetical protein
MSEENTLLAADQGLSTALQNAISLWADARTDPESARRCNLLRDKTKAVTDCFAYVDKHPAQVTALDVKAWQAELERRGLSAATIYAWISHVSSFFDGRWAIQICVKRYPTTPFTWLVPRRQKRTRPKAHRR